MLTQRKAVDFVFLNPGSPPQRVGAKEGTLARSQPGALTTASPFRLPHLRIVSR